MVGVAGSSAILCQSAEESVVSPARKAPLVAIKAGSEMAVRTVVVAEQSDLSPCATVRWDDSDAPAVAVPPAKLRTLKGIDD